MLEIVKKNKWIVLSGVVLSILLLSIFLITRNDRIIYSLYSVQVLLNFSLFSAIIALGILLYFKLLKVIPNIVLLGLIAFLYLLFGFFTLGTRTMYSFVGVVLILSTHFLKEKGVQSLWGWVVAVFVYFIFGTIFFHLFSRGFLSLLHVIAFILAFFYLMDPIYKIKYLKQIYFVATLIIPLWLLFFIGVFASGQFVKSEEEVIFYEISIQDTTYLVKEERTNSMMDSFIELSIYEEIRFGIYNQLGTTRKVGWDLYHLSQEDFTFLVESPSRIKVSIQEEDLEFWITLE